MWMRGCALAMGLGLFLVVVGVMLAADAQWGFMPCEACGGGDVAQSRLAVEVSLLGVILSSLSTAALAAGLMRLARPRAPARPSVDAPPQGPPGEVSALRR